MTYFMMGVGVAFVIGLSLTPWASPIERIAGIGFSGVLALLIAIYARLGNGNG